MEGISRPNSGRHRSEWLIQIYSYHVHGTVCRILPSLSFPLLQPFLLTWTQKQHVRLVDSTPLAELAVLRLLVHVWNCSKEIFNRVLSFSGLTSGTGVSGLRSLALDITAIDDSHLSSSWFSTHSQTDVSQMSLSSFQINLYIHALVAGWSLELETLSALTYVRHSTCAFCHGFFGLVHPHTSLSWIKGYHEHGLSAQLSLDVSSDAIEKPDFSHCRLGKSLPWTGEVFPP